MIIQNLVKFMIYNCSCRTDTFLMPLGSPGMINVWQAVFYKIIKLNHTRRKFLRKLSLIMASIAGLLAFLSLFRIAMPKPSRMDKRIKIGKPGSFPLNDFTYLPEHKIYVHRDNTGMQAVSSICTHLGCAIEKTSDGFLCPCHGSKYDKKGNIISGPALKDLSWYMLYRSPDGQVIVDITKIVDSDYSLRVG
jgi:cytochrome b6-f complex iron-sulfur subunit